MFVWIYNLKRGNWKIGEMVAGVLDLKTSIRRWVHPFLFCGGYCRLWLVSLLLYTVSIFVLELKALKQGDVGILAHEASGAGFFPSKVFLCAIKSVSQASCY